ncbi:MAG: DUF1990 domain-containing protein [Blastocatellia bacterium]|nr:DUF1990 domain-containing protein [Blastocatellia bacterium]
MFFFRCPADAVIRQILADQEKLPLSYPEVGLTREGKAPAGYVVDHNRIALGQGEAVFTLACQALRSWHMFHLSWVRLYWPTAPLETGTVVGVGAAHFGFWSLNPCRIVYVLDEQGASPRYGFGYGTLPGHGERGEERFVIEWDRRYDAVTYDIFAFSKPNHILAQLGYPIVRQLQQCFARESKTAMLSAVRRNQTHVPF